jgi:hypothetical protein
MKTTNYNSRTINAAWYWWSVNPGGCVSLA